MSGGVGCREVSGGVERCEGHSESGPATCPLPGQVEAERILHEARQERERAQQMMEVAKQDREHILAEARYI